jgi:hypothetical protein
MFDILEHEYEIVVPLASVAVAPYGDRDGGDIDGGVLYSCA